MNTLPRAFVPPERWTAEGMVEISVQEWHHLVHVRRMKAGDRVILFDGTGHEAEGLIDSVEYRRIRLLRAWERPPDPLAITLFQAVLKQEAMESVIRKSVELGVSVICPLEADRSIPRLIEKRAAAREERWRTIAREAAHQCGLAWLPTIRPVGRLDAILGELSGLDAAFLGSLEPGARPLLAAAYSLTDRIGRGVPLRVGLAIGPEGDWTPDEHEALLRAGAQPVTFGVNVLKADTAACFGLSVLRALATAAGEIPPPGPRASETGRRGSS